MQVVFIYRRSLYTGGLMYRWPLDQVSLFHYL